MEPILDDDMSWADSPPKEEDQSPSKRPKNHSESPCLAGTSLTQTPALTGSVATQPPALEPSHSVLPLKDLGNPVTATTQSVMAQNPAWSRQHGKYEASPYHVKGVPPPPPMFPPDDSYLTKKRLRRLETAAQQQNDRQGALGDAAQNLVAALSVAINRLDICQSTQSDRMASHEMVMESQHQQARTNHESQQMSSAQTQRQAQCQIDGLMGKYSAAQREWQERQSIREYETLKLGRHIQTLQHGLTQFNASQQPQCTDAPRVGESQKPTLHLNQHIVGGPPPRPMPPFLPGQAPAPDPFAAWGTPTSTPMKDTPMTSSPPGAGYNPPVHGSCPNANAPHSFAPNSYPNVNAPRFTSGHLPTTAVMMTPSTIDHCPVFTPSTYTHWKREMRLWMAGYPSATASQFLSKIISVLPPPAKITGTSYMEASDGAPHLRSVDTLIKQLGERYAKTDTERAWSWLREFTQFSRKPSEKLKDFWARLIRVTTRLDALGGNE